MKITQKQLKQIIREEIQQEGFLDSIGDFIKGTNKDYREFLKKYDAELQKLSKEYHDAYDAAEGGDAEPILAQLGSYDSLAKKNLRFDPKDLSSEQRKQQISVSQKLERLMQSRSDDISDINQAAAKAFEQKMQDIRQKRKEKHDQMMKDLEDERVKDASVKKGYGTDHYKRKKEQEYRDRARDSGFDSYAPRARDAFSESKLTKEDVKQIIREEIKNFKR